jgi:hypothetical protein
VGHSSCADVSLLELVCSSFGITPYAFGLRRLGYPCHSKAKLGTSEKNALTKVEDAACYRKSRATHTAEYMSLSSGI